MSVHVPSILSVNILDLYHWVYICKFFSLKRLLKYLANHVGLNGCSSILRTKFFNERGIGVIWETSQFHNVRRKLVEFMKLITQLLKLIFPNIGLKVVWVARLLHGMNWKIHLLITWFTCKNGQSIQVSTWRKMDDILGQSSMPDSICKEDYTCLMLKSV